MGKYRSCQVVGRINKVVLLKQVLRVISNHFKELFLMGSVKGTNMVSLKMSLNEKELF